jgi:hypothetical protein
LCDASCPQTLVEVSAITDVWRSELYAYPNDYTTIKTDHSARLASAAQRLHWLSGIASLMRTKLLCVCQLRLRMSIDVVGGTQGGCATATHQSAV